MCYMKTMFARRRLKVRVRMPFIINTHFKMRSCRWSRSSHSTCRVSSRARFSWRRSFHGPAWAASSGRSQRTGLSRPAWCGYDHGRVDHLLQYPCRPCVWVARPAGEVNEVGNHPGTKHGASYSAPIFKHKLAGIAIGNSGAARACLSLCFCIALQPNRSGTDKQLSK